MLVSAGFGLAQLALARAQATNAVVETRFESGGSGWHGVAWRGVGCADTEIRTGILGLDAARTDEAPCEEDGRKQNTSQKALMGRDHAVMIVWVVVAC